MAAEAVPTPSQVFAANVRRARFQREWDQTDLAEAVSGLGHPMTRVTVNRLEAKGRPSKSVQASGRGISLDEALVVSMALEMFPVQMFVPGSNSEPVAITPQVRVSPMLVRAWVKGQRPLSADDDGFTYHPVAEDEIAARMNEDMRIPWGLLDQIFDDMREGQFESAVRMTQMLTTYLTDIIERRTRAAEQNEQEQS